MIENNNCGKILTHSDKFFEKKICHKFINFYNNQSELIRLNKNAKKLIKNSGCESIVYNILKI